MPASDLKALREYVANVLDYDPNNETYKREIDRLLNEADRSICLSKPFTFINKAADLQVYSDRTASLTFNNGSQLVNAGAAFFEDWMVNQEVEVDNKTYRFSFISSSTQARIDRPFESPNGTYETKVINRYIDLPDDCTTVLNVARRTNTRTPNDPGMLSPLTRYEDEWHNLPLGETNVPIYWLYHDPAFIDGPRRNFDTNSFATTGAGVRTIEFTSTYIRGGRESAHGEIVSRTYQDNQTASLTPYSNSSNDGRRKRYYFRAPTLGYYGWRLLTDQTGADMDLAPSDNATRQFPD